MDMNSHTISIGASILNMSNKNTNDSLNPMLSIIPTTDDTEADVLNDETFGDCDLDAIKIKSDFGENGEFLGDYSSESLPDFFDSDISDTGGREGMSLIDNDDQSQQPSIDALLGEDPMSMSTASMNLRQSSSINPLFNMAISQAINPNHGNIFTQQPMTIPTPPPPPQPQINYQLLKQFEQMLINRQIPAQERIIYIQAMIEKMHRDAINIQQQTSRIRDSTYSLEQTNINGHDRSYETNQNRIRNTNLAYEGTRSMAIGEMMDRAHLTAININNSRSQSPTVATSSGISSQFMDAIQRSDQIPIVDNQQQQQQQQNQTNKISSSLDTIVSPSHHVHHNSRQNRPAKHYPRPPLLNTWQGRGPGHDEFAGLMSDREKQWVVKIQLHQASQTQEEDYYYHKWSQQKRHTQQTHGNQTNRHGHRGQKISYPVLQLLKSIQQENELAQRLSQTSTQASFSNVNPAHSLPYASPISTQLGKQSIATPRHPRCTLHLDGVFSLGRRANAITHDKYTLGVLLNIENLYRDILRLNPTNEDEISSNQTNTSDVTSQSLNSIIDRYLNHPTYLFGDMFGNFHKGQIILERLYPYIKNTKHLETMFIRLYSSLCYMVHQWPTTFHIEPSVMNTIHIILQQVTSNKSTFERLLTQIYTYFNEHIKVKLVEIHPDLSTSTSPFSDPVLLTNSFTVTILMELLLNLERHCYLLPDANSSNVPIQILQQLQPQLQYQLSEQVRLIVADICQALISCSSPVYTLKKMLRPFVQAKHQQFGLLCKFIQIQISQQVYITLESKLIYCCIKDNN